MLLLILQAYQKNWNSHHYSFVWRIYTARCKGCYLFEHSITFCLLELNSYIRGHFFTEKIFRSYRSSPCDAKKKKSPIDFSLTHPLIFSK